MANLHEEVPIDMALNEVLHAQISDSNEEVESSISHCDQGVLGKRSFEGIYLCFGRNLGKRDYLGENDGLAPAHGHHELGKYNACHTSLETFSESLIRF